MSNKLTSRVEFAVILEKLQLNGRGNFRIVSPIVLLAPELEIMIYLHKFFSFQFFFNLVKNMHIALIHFTKGKYHIVFH